MQKKAQPSRINEGQECIFVYTFLRPISQFFTKFYILLGLSPNTVTFLGFLLGLLACYFFYLGDRASLIYGGLLAYISLVHSASDGEVARLTNKKSALGEFLDSIMDIIKIYFLFLALSIGYYRATGDLNTLLLGIFAGGGHLIGHYIRVYSYKILKEKKYELRFTKRFVFYFTVFVVLVLIAAALFNFVKPFLIAMAIIYPLTWLKKIYSVIRQIKTQA